MDPRNVVSPLLLYSNPEKKKSLFDRVLQKHLCLPIFIGCQGLVLLILVLKVRERILSICPVAKHCTRRFEVK